MDTVWVLGDPLSRGITPLAERAPGDVRVLFVVSRGRMRAGRIHRQRLHLVWTAMRRFAAGLEAEGFAVDWREAEGFAQGLEAHRARFRPGTVEAMEPSSLPGRRHLEAQGVRLRRDNRFLCHDEDFAAWAGERERVRMEDFYRWQRRRLGVLMGPGKLSAGSLQAARGFRASRARAPGRPRRPRPPPPPSSRRRGGSRAGWASPARSAARPARSGA